MSGQTINNCITDVEGIIVGQYTDTKAASGVTVILCPDGAVGGVDVRGSAPGTRETDLLDPVNLVDECQAVLLSGGSVYGLAAADGVVRYLEEKGWGFKIDETHVCPIVPAAVLFDLGIGESFVPPIDASWGKKAAMSAKSGIINMGNYGAGTGATAGSIKGGIGSASAVIESGITVGAIAAVNPSGSVIDPVSGKLWEKRLEQRNEFGEQALRAVKIPEHPSAQAGKNTTIACVATDARLTKAQANKVAQMAQDGLARAIRPSHTMFDGDTVFCLATGKKTINDQAGYFNGEGATAVNEIGAAAADCLARACIRGVLEAESVGAFKAFRDLEDR